MRDDEGLDEVEDSALLSKKLDTALDETSRLRAENQRLRALLGLPDPAQVAEAAVAYRLFPLSVPLPKVEDSSPIHERVRLMRELFRGRDDVYAVRWASARTGKVGYSPATAGGWSDSKKPSKNYLALTDDVMEEHLSGRQAIGIYPLLRDDTCLFLACDFDGKGWGGKDRRTCVVDVAMIQSLRTVKDLEALFGCYGLLVIDECHHVPAVSFEACVRRAPLRFILGLTATPYRKDGLDDLITMQCGPIRHAVERGGDGATKLQLELHIRRTSLALEGSEELSIQDVFRALVDNKERSQAIVRDIDRALSDRRRCLVLSQWKEHVRTLAEILRTQNIEPIVLEGGMRKKQREQLLERIATISPDEHFVIIATGQYIGEGFDCPQLDTLFLAFPVAFKGKLVQYTGRILRAHEGKQTAIAYDYADSGVPVLKAMFAKRLRTYRTLGFVPTEGADSAPDAVASVTGGPGCSMDFDGYWIHASSGEKPPYDIVGKYLFFSENKDRLIEIARNEILNHGFHRAKVNAEMLGNNREHVLCLYYRDDSRKDELAERAKSEYQVKFRYWKSDADTRDGKYSDEFLGKLDSSAQVHFTPDGSRHQT